MTLVAACAMLLTSAPKAVICIDPGHPSEIGRGTTGKKITEIEAAWVVALQLKGRLEADGYSVTLTKSSRDQLVTNRQRAAIANKSKAQLLVRLHCDHAVGGSGFATYFAEKQGRHEGRIGPKPEVLAKVKAMAKPFHLAAIAVLKGSLEDRGLRKDTQTSVGAKYGALIGSIYSEVPSLLVEMAVLNNPRDDGFMASRDGQAKMAEALFAGIKAAIALRR